MTDSKKALVEEAQRNPDIFWSARVRLLIAERKPHRAWSELNRARYGIYIGPDIEKGLVRERIIALTRDPKHRAAAAGEAVVNELTDELMKAIAKWASSFIEKKPDAAEWPKWRLLARLLGARRMGKGKKRNGKQNGQPKEKKADAEFAAAWSQ